MLTVAELLNNKAFSDFVVLSGHGGLSKEVKLVTVMDAPDPFQWSIGGEIVLTSGYVFKENQAIFKEILLSMKESGNVALFIKVERFFDEIPKDVLDYSDEIGFPIVEIPLKRSFAEIINPVLTQVVKSQSKALLISDNINRVFTNLVINDSDTQSIIDSLSEVIKSDIMFIDTYFSERYISKDVDLNRLNRIDCKVSQEYIDELMKMNAKDLLDIFSSYQIGNTKTIYGYLIFLSGGIVNDYHDALTHANTALILDIQKKICSTQIESRHRNEFVQDIIMNNIKYREEVYERANLYGWSISDKILVMDIDIDELKARYHPNSQSDLQAIEDVREKILQRVISIVKKFFNKAIYASLSDSVVFVLEMDELFNRYIDICIEDIKTSIRECYGFTVTIGIGSEKNDVMKIYQSYNEAKLSIDIARIIYHGNIHARYDNLGIYKLIYSLKDNEELKEYYISNLGPILEYDRFYDTELYNTLGVIIDNNWNLRKASEDMYIHYNTMKYRYRKIAEVLGKDLNETDSRLSLTLSWRIGEIKKGK